MRKLLVTLVVLAVLAVLVDRAGDYAAEQVVARQLQSSQGLANPPDVNIAGFPFLSQFANGSYDHVTVTANEVRIGRSASSLALNTLLLDLRDVTASKRFDTFRANRLTARATVSYPALSRTVGIRIRYAGASRISASREFKVRDRKVSLQVAVRPVLTRDALVFDDPTVSGLDDAPPALGQVLVERFQNSLPLTSLPFGVKAKSLRVTPAGLVLTLTGRGLSYRP